MLELIRRKRNLDIGEISFEQYEETENNLTILEELFEDVLHGNLSVEDKLHPEWHLKFRELLVESSTK